MSSYAECPEEITKVYKNCLSPQTCVARQEGTSRFLQRKKNNNNRRLYKTTESTDKLKQAFKLPPDVSSKIKLSNSGADIAKLAADEGQEEVLIRAGAYFKVVEVKGWNEDNPFMDPKGSPYYTPSYTITLEEKLAE